MGGEFQFAAQNVRLGWFAPTPGKNRRVFDPRSVPSTMTRRESRLSPLRAHRIASGGLDAFSRVFARMWGSVAGQGGSGSSDSGAGDQAVWNPNSLDSGSLSLLSSDLGPEVRTWRIEAGRGFSRRPIHPGSIPARYPYIWSRDLEISPSPRDAIPSAPEPVDLQAER